MRTVKIKKLGTLIELLNDRIDTLRFYLTIYRDPHSGGTRVDVCENYTGKVRTSLGWFRNTEMTYDIPDDVLAQKPMVLSGNLMPRNSVF